MDHQSTEVFLFGAAIADVVAQPFDPARLHDNSQSVRAVVLTVGGDALNEATVLRRLGHGVTLRTTLGDDDAGMLVRAHLVREGVDLQAVTPPGLSTGVNVVLVQAGGERHFLTDPKGSLRRFSLEDALPALDTPAFQSARIATLASMFVSPQLDAEAMAELFRHCRQAGKVVCADATRCKNGETAESVACALRELDWFFPNLDEARKLTGRERAEDVAKALLKLGVRNLALKMGSRGCLLATGAGMAQVPAVPSVRAVDTTGAGDTFAAAFQAALLEGRPPRECAAFANAAASLCVEAVGATRAKLDRAEIEARMG